MARQHRARALLERLRRLAASNSTAAFCSSATGASARPQSSGQLAPFGRASWLAQRRHCRTHQQRFEPQGVRWAQVRPSGQRAAASRRWPLRRREKVLAEPCWLQRSRGRSNHLLLTVLCLDARRPRPQRSRRWLLRRNPRRPMRRLPGCARCMPARSGCRSRPKSSLSPAGSG